MHYDPFSRGAFPVGVKTVQTSDPARDRRPLRFGIPLRDNMRGRMLLQPSEVRGLSLAHLDAVLKDGEGAQRLLASDLEGLLASRGVDIAVV